MALSYYYPYRFILTYFLFCFVTNNKFYSYFLLLLTLTPTLTNSRCSPTVRYTTRRKDNRHRYNNCTTTHKHWATWTLIIVNHATVCPVTPRRLFQRTWSVDDRERVQRRRTRTGRVIGRRNLRRAIQRLQTSKKTPPAMWRLNRSEKCVFFLVTLGALTKANRRSVLDATSVVIMVMMSLWWDSPEGYHTVPPAQCEPKLQWCPYPDTTNTLWMRSFKRITVTTLTK